MPDPETPARQKPAASSSSFVYSAMSNCIFIELIPSLPRRVSPCELTVAELALVPCPLGGP